MNPVDERERAARTEHTLREIHEITTSPEFDLPEQFRKVLALGCQQFQLPFGALSRHDGDYLEIRHVVSPNNEMQEAMALELCDTFCSETLRRGESLGIHDVGNSEWKGHAAHRALGLESYIGTTIVVDGKTWGTLCFFDFEPRPEPFSSTDFDLLKLMAQRAQAGLESSAADQRLRAVMEGTAGATGEDFFRSMVRHVAEAIDVRFALVTEYIDEERIRARSLAFWAGKDYADNFEFEVAGTPCEGVTGDEVKLVTRDVQTLFPGASNLVALGADGFVGVPIRCVSGSLLGHLIATDNRPLNLNTHKEWILKIFAARAGAEIARLRAEKVSRDREERYQLATSTARVGVWDLDVRSGELVADANLSDLLDIPTDELPRTVAEWMELVHPDDRAEVDHAAREHIKGHTPEYVTEHRMLHTDGSIRWVMVRGNAVRDESGYAMRLAGTRMDITERRRLEEIIRNVAEGVSATTGDAFFSSLVEYLANAFGVCCAFVGKVVDENRSTVELIALWTGSELAPPRTYRVVGTPCEAVLVQGSAHYPRGVSRMELPRELTNTGIESYMAIALSDPQGAPIGLLGIMDRAPLDDPEFPDTVLRIFAARATAELKRVRAEDEQRSLERQIQHAEKLKSLGVLAGGIAHDFNNLLTGILGNASLALSKMPEDSPALIHIRRIESATKRAENLTKQMLAYSGKGTFVVVPLDLNGLVQEMSELLSTAVSKTAKMDTVFAPGLPAIEADGTQVRQVIMNLMMNASDSLEELAGTIGVRTGVVEVGENELDPSALSKSMSPGRHVYVEVSDTGAGMDVETQRRMFDPFFSTKFAGRGLGMSAVLGIVQGHRGGIQVHSTVGVGTTIRVMFPASSKPVPDELISRAVASLRTGERTALVVDDEEMVRDVIQNVLQANGVQVFAARDGFEALEFVKSGAHEIDLVLLDLTMPGMDGSATLDKLRSIDSNVPVILMSGYDEKDATLRFGDGSLAGFLQKPFDAAALMSTIEQVLAD